MSIPVSQFISLPLPPWYPYICFLHLCLCFASKIIYTNFFFRFHIYALIYDICGTYIQWNITPPHNKEWNWVIHRNTGGPRDYHTEWSKLEREKQIYSSYFWVGDWAGERWGPGVVARAKGEKEYEFVTTRGEERMTGKRNQRVEETADQWLEKWYHTKPILSFGSLKTVS